MFTVLKDLAQAEIPRQEIHYRAVKEKSMSIKIL